MADTQTNATDAGGTQDNNAEANVEMNAENTATQNVASAQDDNPPVSESKPNSDIMTSSQFRDAERKKSGVTAPERKAPDAAEAEVRSAKLREMELIKKNRVEVVPPAKATQWGPILWVVGFIVIVALLWSWFS